MKNYNQSYNKKDKKANTFIWFISEAIFIFIIATAAIVLYDMYINIDVVPYESYNAEKISMEVNSESENVDSISEMLEAASKSVVRNIKNCIK